MNELILYKIFRTILSQSKTIAGRFHTAPENGNEINTNNVGEFIKDFLGNMASTRKYPLAILLPPVEQVPGYEENSFSRFRLQMFFLKMVGSNNGISQGLNVATNSSEHRVEYDWKEMRECAVNFRKALDLILIKNRLLNQIRTVNRGSDYIQRVSFANNDKTAGVSITFEIDLFLGCDMKDYELSVLENITLSTDDPHPLHR